MRWSDVVFFASGLAALAYETSWARLLSRITGSDAAGTAIVLATYMAGLGLGARLFATLARRVTHPRLTFALLECLIAAWAFSSPWTLDALTSSPLTGSWVARACAAALALLPPTLAMGATFPLMGRLTIADARETGSAVGSFYGANTLGAAAGALLGPFWLMPTLGLSGALRAAAGLGVLAALGARWLPRVPRVQPGRPAAEQPALEATPAAAGLTTRPLPAWRYLLVTFAMGLAALALEVLLTRLLITVTGASVYAFALVLAVFLIGIGLGSRQLAGPWGAADRAPGVVLWSALAVAPLALLGALALRVQLGESDLFAGLANRLPSGASTTRLWASHALFAGLALFPPALAFGMSLPASAAAITATRAARGSCDTERALGLVYAANTLGALLGSLAAAFVLLPQLGLRAGLAAVLALPWLAALCAARARRELAACAGTLLLVLPLGWLALRPAADGAAALARAVGRHATASVEENETPAGRVRALRVNGKVVATTAAVDLRLQRLLGLIPALLHGEVERALVIGLGTGMTAGSLESLDSLEQLDVFEICESVVELAPYFSAWNGELSSDPRTRITITDGRYALAHSRARWDLITADPIHPWTRGSSDLYSLEHFEQIAAHLAPGGVASQWLPLYQLAPEDVRIVVATWIEVFPHASAWITAYDLALVGSLEPLPGADLSATSGPSSGRAESGLRSVFERLTAAWTPAVGAELEACGIHGPAELAVLYVGDRSRLAAFAAGAEPMRDDFPVLEFRAPKSYLAGYATEALAWAAEQLPFERLPGLADSTAALASASALRAREVRDLLRQFLAELPRGYEDAAARYGAALLALPPLDGPP